MNKKILITIVTVLVILFAVFFLCENNNKYDRSNDNNTENTLDEEVPYIDDEETFKELDLEKLTTYENKEIGIRFSYPESFGEIKESYEQGCWDDGNRRLNEGLLTDDDKCFSIYLSFTNFKKDATFFSTRSFLKEKYPIGRGGFWGDKTEVIRNPNFLSDFCSGISGDDSFPISSECELYYTKKSQIPVFKRLEEKPFVENEKITVYYIKSSNPIYQGIVMSPERLPIEIEEFEKIIDSIEFLKE